MFDRNWPSMDMYMSCDRVFELQKFKNRHDLQNLGVVEWTKEEPFIYAKFWQYTTFPWGCSQWQGLQQDEDTTLIQLGSRIENLPPIFLRFATRGKVSDKILFC